MTRTQAIAALQWERKQREQVAARAWEEAQELSTLEGWLADVVPEPPDGMERLQHYIGLMAHQVAPLENELRAGMKAGTTDDLNDPRR